MKIQPKCRTLFYLLLTILQILLSRSSMGYEYFGRASLGTFMAREDFYSNTDGAQANDFQHLSGRFYIRVSDMGTDQYEFITDIRDKYDMFGTLNTSQQQLDPSNKFQLRSFYVGNFPSKNKFNFSVGRFSLIESGGTYTDGLVMQRKWTETFRTGLFGGMNPYSDATEYVTYVPNAYNYGLYTSYEPSTQKSDRNYFLNHAFVVTQYNGDIDREYFYQNIYFQWEPKSRLMSTLYVDFIPTTKVQTGTLNWDQKVADKMTTHLGYLGIDTITYRRLQSVRSTLTASPYNEGKASLDFIYGNGSMITPQISSGLRSVDGLTKTEARVNYLYNEFKDHRYDGSAFAGTRNNFTSTDLFLGFGAGFYSQKWEFSSEIEYTQEVEQKYTLHPIFLSVNASYISNRALYYIASVELAQDENVTIFAAFLKLTYRFGSKETAPLRDGAPVRRSL